MIKQLTRLPSISLLTLIIVLKKLDIQNKDSHTNLNEGKQAALIKTSVGIIKCHSALIKCDAALMKCDASLIKCDADLPDPDLIRTDADLNIADAELIKADADMIIADADMIKCEADSIITDAVLLKEEADSIIKSKAQIKAEITTNKLDFANPKEEIFFDEDSTKNDKTPNKDTDPANVNNETTPMESQLRRMSETLPIHPAANLLRRSCLKGTSQTPNHLLILVIKIMLTMGKK